MYGPRGLFSCSILHLILRLPFLVVPVAVGLLLAMPYLRNLPEKALPQSIITFSFDDGYASVYEKALPILERYGYVGTVFVITSAIGQSGYMTLEQLLNLAKRGWEIGSHTVSHRYLTELSPSELEFELWVSKRHLEGLGLTVVSFAPPGGEYNQTTIEAVAKHYLCQRISWPDGLNDIPLSNPEDRYRLQAVSVEAKTTVEEIQQWILLAKENKKWLILLFHRIDESGDHNWSSQDFETIVRFSREQGFRGISLSNVVK